LPRASLLFGPFAGFTLSASIGKGVRAADPSDVAQDAKTPFSSIESYEGGVSYVRQTDDWALSARSVFFVTRVDRDLIFDENLGRKVQSAGTTRSGWAGSVRTTGKFLDESATVTLVKAEFNDTHLSVENVPAVILRSDTALFAELPWRWLGERARGALGLGVAYVGPRPLPLGERSAPVFTLDSSASLSFSHYELGLSGMNLLGTRYRSSEFNFASDFHSPGSGGTSSLVPARSFTAAAPRTLLGSFAIHFGGE